MADVPLSHKHCWLKDKEYDYAEYQTSSTNLRFTSANSDLSNIPFFISFSDLPSMMQVNTTTSGSVPAGEDVKVLVMAVDTNQILNYFIESFSITSNRQVEIELIEVSEDDLMDFLDGL